MIKGVVNRPLTDEELKAGYLIPTKFAANVTWSMRDYHGFEKAYYMIRAAYGLNSLKGTCHGCKTGCNRN